MSKDGDEKKATEELLSGFDRPGRTPRSPAVKSRDFVDYYSGRSAPVTEPLPLVQKRQNGEEKPERERATVVVPRTNKLRTTMTWVVAVGGMILFGVTIAVLATPQTPASPAPVVTVSPMAPTPTSATTITSANPPAAVEDPVEPSPAPVPTIQKKTPLAPSAAAAPPTIKSVPRDDFIRDL